MKKFLLRSSAVALSFLMLNICKDVWGFETTILVIASLFLADGLLKKTGSE